MPLAIVSADLIRRVHLVLEDALSPFDLTRRAWDVRVERALRPLPADRAVGLTDAQLGRVLRVLREAQSPYEDCRRRSSWERVRQQTIAGVEAVQRRSAA